MTAVQGVKYFKKNIMRTKEKILSCYPHVTTASISKMVGCKRNHVYTLLKECGLPIKKLEYDFWKKFYNLYQ